MDEKQLIENPISSLKPKKAKKKRKVAITRDNVTVSNRDKDLKTLSKYKELDLEKLVFLNVTIGKLNEALAYWQQLYEFKEIHIDLDINLEFPENLKELIVEMSSLKEKIEQHTQLTKKFRDVVAKRYKELILEKARLEEKLNPIGLKIKKSPGLSK